MDYSTVAQLIGSLGFPIMACIGLFYYLTKEQESHKQEMQSVTEALNRNTEVMIELKTILTTLTGRRKTNEHSET